MKLLSYACLAGVALLSACNGSNNDPAPDPTPATGPFVAKVDGAQFKSDNTKAKAKYVTSTRMLQVISQTSDQKETVLFNIIGMGANFTYFTPGTYDFDPARIAAAQYAASGGYNMWDGSTYVNWSTNWTYVKAGNVVIESITPTHVKGTFFFDAVKQNPNGTFDAGSVKKITEGAFDLDITRI